MTTTRQLKDRTLSKVTPPHNLYAEKALRELDIPHNKRLPGHYSVYKARNLLLTYCPKSRQLVARTSAIAAQSYFLPSIAGLHNSEWYYIDALFIKKLLSEAEKLSANLASVEFMRAFYTSTVEQRKKFNHHSKSDLK